MRVARVVVDIPTRQIDEPFDYSVPDGMELELGVPVLVDFGSRPVVGYVVALAPGSEHSLKPVRAVLGDAALRSDALPVAEWIAHEYGAPLASAVRLFAPPGGTPRARKKPEGGWELFPAAVGAVDDRWVELADPAFVPATRATTQRAIIAALAEGPVPASELTARYGRVDSALRRLSEQGAIVIEHRRRYRESVVREKPAPRHADLSEGQRQSRAAIAEALAAGGGTVLLDGVTGSGKTEVYLRAIEEVRAAGGDAIVLVPEISLTPQTVGRFRTRFGDDVAVLHSGLSAGERYDQWQRIALGDAHIVVGARSALFAPVRDLHLIVIDEEHDHSYKQSSTPRYHARAVAAAIAEVTSAVVVLGSGTPSLETLEAAEAGDVVRVRLGERVAGGALPAVQIVDMAAEFSAGHRSMFSRPLLAEIARVEAAGDKAVLLLNRRGFASFLLCRECGFVPTCDQCATSLTYHEVGSRLVCHHCSSVRRVPAVCPECESPYLRLFGAGTQRVEAELAEITSLPVVRMDADTTTGRGGHDRALVAFETLDSGILLGTQMIAKGLDYPEVTLVGVLNADTSLHLPDFRSGERTWQLLEQVAGRAGRGPKGGTVVVQTYWPDHPAIQAVATHDRAAYLASERELRSEAGYPPYARLANLIVRGREERAVAERAEALRDALVEAVPGTWRVLGPAPAPLARIKGAHRWHLLIKAPVRAPLARVIGPVLDALPRPPRDSVAVVLDVDPADLL